MAGIRGLKVIHFQHHLFEKLFSLGEYDNQRLFKTPSLSVSQPQQGREHLSPRGKDGEDWDWGEQKVGQLGSAVCRLNKQRSSTSQSVCPFLSRGVGPTRNVKFPLSEERILLLEEPKPPQSTSSRCGSKGARLAARPVHSAFIMLSSWARQLSKPQPPQLLSRGKNMHVIVSLCEGYRKNKNVRMIASVSFWPLELAIAGHLFTYVQDTIQSVRF